MNANLLSNRAAQEQLSKEQEELKAFDEMIDALMGLNKKLTRKDRAALKEWDKLYKEIMAE